jgi:8-oxo-dGTP diphosphatase
MKGPEFGELPSGTRADSRRAAYVVIGDDKGRVAVVRGGGSRRESYWLPGGGSEAGESPEDTIEREVTEELGRQVRVVARLGAAVQVFFAEDEKRWFRMEATFFEGELGGDSRAAAENEMEWVEPEAACRGFFHACHAWAVRQSTEKGDFS